MASGTDHPDKGVDLDDLVAVGVVRRPHGVHGEASVELLTDSAARFEDLDRVYLVAPTGRESIETSVLGVRAHKERALVRLDGITTPEGVSRFRDWTIEIPGDEARELDANEFFLHELVGLEVFDQSETRLGRVVDTLEGPVQILLSVEDEDEMRFQIPFVKELCPVVDLASGRIIVDLPDGLLDLNREGSGR